MRRLSLTAVTVLQGAVACGTVWGFEEPILVDVVGSGTPDGGPTVEAGSDAPPVIVVETPPAPGDPTRACVPKAPDGWQGPLVIFEGSGAPLPTPPACLEGYKPEPVYDGFGGFVAPDVACTCECLAPTGGSCSAKAAFFTDKDCTQPCSTPTLTYVSGAACAPAPEPCQFGKTTAVTMQPGTCAANIKAKQPKIAPTFTTISRVCAALDAPQQGSCPADRVATPKTSLPFNTGAYCIARTGAEACPETYPNRRVYYRNDAVFDDRDCDCACGSAQNASCTGSAIGWDKADCSGGPKTWTSTACIEAKQPFANFVASDVKPGSCAPEARPKGAATPTTPTTLCCTQ